MQDGTISKNIGIKFVGSNRATETISISPGTTTRDVLKSLGLATGFQLGDAHNDIVFAPDDILYARVQDGDLLHASAFVDAGDPHPEARHGLA